MSQTTRMGFWCNSEESRLLGLSALWKFLSDALTVLHLQQSQCEEKSGSWTGKANFLLALQFELAALLVSPPRTGKFFDQYTWNRAPSNFDSCPDVRRLGRSVANEIVCDGEGRQFLVNKNLICSSTLVFWAEPREKHVQVGLIQYPLSKKHYHVCNVTPRMQQLNSAGWLGAYRNSFELLSCPTRLTNCSHGWGMLLHRSVSESSETGNRFYCLETDRNRVVYMRAKSRLIPFRHETLESFGVPIPSVCFRGELH